MKKLGKRQKRLLFEAARRYILFAPKGTALTDVETGVGLWYEYKTMFNAGLMTFTMYYDRAPMWWKLTSHGARFVKKIIENNTIEEIQNKLYNN